MGCSLLGADGSSRICSARETASSTNLEFGIIGDGAAAADKAGSICSALALSDNSSSTSITQSPWPTFATSPSFTRISFTIPSNGLVISTLALSLWTSHKGSKLWIAPSSLTFLSYELSGEHDICKVRPTHHLMTSHSVMPSPISASLKFCRIFLEDKHGGNVWKCETAVGRVRRRRRGRMNMVTVRGR